MTIASRMYSGYKSDDTLGLDDLLEKCDDQAVEILYVSTVYRFEDGSQISHCGITNKVEVI